MSLLLLFRPRGGGTPPPPPPVVVVAPGGVKKRGQKAKREIRINLADRPREDITEFLKTQLRLRHPDSAFHEPEPVAPKKVPRARKIDAAALERQKQDALRNMEIERAMEERQKIEEHNAKMMQLINLILMSDL